LLLCCSVVICAVLLLLCCTGVICVVQLLLFMLFYVLFVCKCVLYHCHRVYTQLQLTKISVSTLKLTSFVRNENIRTKKFLWTQPLDRRRVCNPAHWQHENFSLRSYVCYDKLPFRDREFSLQGVFL